MPLVRRARPKKRRQKPDETFQYGPIVLERYGRFTRVRNLADAEYFRQIKAKTPEIVRKFESEIRGAVTELRAILAPLQPIPFLQNAYCEFFVAHLGIEDEPSLTQDHAHALRMIDYCSSIFAATAPSENPRIHSEDEFRLAKECIKKLFNATRQYVLWSGRGEQDFENDPTATALDVLTKKLTLQWIFIRSDRHSAFEIPHYQTLLEGLGPVLKRVLTIDTATLISGLQNILENAQSGLASAGLILKQLHERSTAHPDFEKVLILPDGKRQDALARLADLEPSVVSEAIESFFGTRLFNVTKSTRWPIDLLNRLSYQPGEASYFLEPADNACSPTRVWPIFQRPFLKLDEDEIYCFDYISFFDKFYRQLQRILRELDPSCVEEINRLQSVAVENATTSLLSAIIPNCTVYKNAYYRMGGEWFECDAIVTYKDALLAIEVRSGSMTPTSPQEDLPSYFRSVESLIVKPADQAWRVLDALGSGSLEIFDSNKPSRVRLALLQKSSFQLVIPVAVSLDHLHMMGAHFAHTVAATRNERTRPTWVLSLDDFRCFEKIFDSPGIFLHYAQKRMMAAAEISVEVHDEMDHLGLYFRENDYIQQTKDFSGHLARIGYTSDIDKYFFSLGIGEAGVRPSQHLSSQIKLLIQASDQSAVPLSRMLLSQILDGDNQFRAELSAWIKDQIESPPAQERFRLCFFLFDKNMLAFLFSNHWTSKNKDNALNEAKARLLKAARSEEMLVGYLSSQNDTLVLVDCNEVKKTNISDAERDQLKPVSDTQMKRDFSQVKGKIGRNEPCPCGSGLKYKKCCLDRLRK